MLCEEGWDKLWAEGVTCCGSRERHVVDSGCVVWKEELDMLWSERRAW